MNTFRFKKRYKVLIGFVILIAILLFAAPRVGRWYIVKNSLDLVGRNMTIDKIRLNYFTGTIRIENLKLFESKSDSVFLSFKRLKVNLNYLPLFKNEIFVKYISLDDPNVMVLQNGDIFNFSDLMTSDTLQVVKDTIPDKPIMYIINNISINRGFVKYTDQLLDHSISMNRIDLNIPGFTWNSDSTRLGVDFRFIDGGRLYSNLALNQADSTYSVTLKLDSLNLNIIEPYVENSMYISAISGYLSNDIIITGDMRSIMNISVQGTNQIFDFQMQDTLKRTIFSFDEFSVDVDTFLLEQNRISLNNIKIARPFIFVELIDSANNWLNIMKPSPEAVTDTLHQNTDTLKTEDKSSFTFSKLEIAEGKIKLTDKTLRYPFEYTIDNIMISSSPDKKIPEWIDITMSAGLNGTGSFKAELALDPLSASDMDISLSIGQFRMKDVEPYFMHYFGFPVTSGRMNFSTQNSMRANSLKSNNSIYFRKFNLAKKSDEKTEYNIPLRLALGVMSDKDGIIDLKAPVEMEGENVKVGNVRKIVFHAIGTLFVKAAVSPLNMIGGLFQVDPEKLETIHLLLTDPSPDKENMKSVDLLADILNKKPGLDIDIVYCINNPKTADTLAYILASEDYARSTGTSGTGSNTVPDSILSRFILGKMPADSLLAKSGLRELCRNYAGAEKLNFKIDSLRSSQASFLQSYMVNDKMIPADRFRIVSIMPDSIKYEETVPSFRIFFTAGDENPVE
ncbi:MAG: DUF748 domain-containing protein [Bacteroidales bacterium]|nr:DUF748 domain-containing protein [Bacteroidales bacterium]